MSSVGDQGPIVDRGVAGLREGALQAADPNLVRNTWVTVEVDGDVGSVPLVALRALDEEVQPLAALEDRHLDGHIARLSYHGIEVDRRREQRNEHEPKWHRNSPSERYDGARSAVHGVRRMGVDRGG